MPGTHRLDDPRAAHEELLRRCAAKDPEAFDALYERTAPLLWGIVLRMLRHPAAAEDALQETYLSIWARAGDYRPALGAPLTWMTSIARYRALDALRRRGRREDVQLPLDEEAHADPFADLAESRADDARTLADCLARLGEEQRACIVLSYCEGYTHGELAARFERPEGTVKSWIRRGVKVLRGCLDGEPS